MQMGAYGGAPQAYGGTPMYGVPMQNQYGAPLPGGYGAPQPSPFAAPSDPAYPPKYWYIWENIPNVNSQWQ